MSYILKTHQISVKDPATGQYSGVDILAEQTEQGLIAELQAEGTTQVNRIGQAAVDVQAAVDKAESDAAGIISETQQSINTLEREKNTIAATVASMAELGTDTTLTTPGMAADAGAVGELNRQLSDLGDIERFKTAILQLAQKVAYIDTGGAEYYSDLLSALYIPSSISVAFTQTKTVYDDDTLDVLTDDLVVTATYFDSTTVEIPSSRYTLSGTLTKGASTITVSYQGKAGSFTVEVTGLGEELSCSLANMTLPSTMIGTRVGYDQANDRIWMKCNSASDISGYKVWVIGAKSVLWDSVVGKQLRIRFSIMSPNWSGEQASNNQIAPGVAICKNANLTSGTERQKFAAPGNVVPSDQYENYDYIFNADLSNFYGGTGTPTSVSTFAATIYMQSYHTAYINKISIKEVLT